MLWSTKWSLRIRWIISRGENDRVKRRVDNSILIMMIDTFFSFVIRHTYPYYNHACVIVLDLYIYFMPLLHDQKRVLRPSWEGTKSNLCPSHFWDDLNYSCAIWIDSLNAKFLPFLNLTLYSCRLFWKK